MPATVMPRYRIAAALATLVGGACLSGTELVTPPSYELRAPPRVAALKHAWSLG